MSQSVRTAAVFVGLLGAVVAASYFYSRSVRGVSAPSGAAATGPEHDPRPLSAEVSAGIEALRAERFEEARQHLESVPASDPSYLVALQQLGAVYAALGDLEASLAVLQKLAALQPDAPEVYSSLAWAQHRLDQDQAAEMSILRTLELDPTNLPARYHVAYFRMARGDVAAAIRAYHRAVQQDTSHVYVLRAAQEVEQLAQRRPEQADVHYVLAYFGRILGQPDVELRELEQFLAMQPEGPAAAVARERLAEVQAPGS